MNHIIVAVGIKAGDEYTHKTLGKGKIVLIGKTILTGAGTPWMNHAIFEPLPKVEKKMTRQEWKNASFTFRNRFTVRVNSNRAVKEMFFMTRREARQFFVRFCQMSDDTGIQIEYRNSGKVIKSHAVL